MKEQSRHARRARFICCCCVNYCRPFVFTANLNRQSKQEVSAEFPFVKKFGWLVTIWEKSNKNSDKILIFSEFYFTNSVALFALLVTRQQIAVKQQQHVTFTTHGKWQTAFEYGTLFLDPLTHQHDYTLSPLYYSHFLKFYNGTTLNYFRF